VPAANKQAARKFFPGAPFIVLILMIFLPIVVYYFWISVHYHHGCLFMPTAGDLKLIPAPTTTSIAIYGLWVLFQTLLQIFAPGKIQPGRSNADGTRLKYKMNGLFSFWLTWVVVAFVAWMGWVTPNMIYENFGSMITTANIFAYALAIFLYIYGKVTKQEERWLLMKWRKPTRDTSIRATSGYSTLRGASRES